MTPDKDPRPELQATGFRGLIDRRDANMTRTYIQVTVLEAVIIVGLLIFGRIFS